MTISQRVADGLPPKPQQLALIRQYRRRDKTHFVSAIDVASLLIAETVASERSAKNDYELRPVEIVHAYVYDMATTPPTLIKSLI